MNQDSRRSFESVSIFGGFSLVVLALALYDYRVGILVLGAGLLTLGIRSLGLR
jgi:hypothetical protein